MKRKLKRLRAPSKAAIKAMADAAEAGGYASEPAETGPDLIPIDPPIIPLTPLEPIRAHKAARPVFNETIVPQVKEWAQNGDTDYEIAQNLGIGRRTLYKWSAAHESFRHALRLGKLAANRRVERSLYSMAVGHRKKSLKIMQHEGNPVIVPYIEEMAPDVGAAKLWLTNRDPKRWADKSEVAVNAHISGDGLAELAIARRLAFALNRAHAVDIEAEATPALPAPSST